MKTDSIKKRQRCDHGASNAVPKNNSKPKKNRNEDPSSAYTPYNTFGLATMNQIM
jgi:hypothetical protein